MKIFELDKTSDYDLLEPGRSANVARGRAWERPTPREARPAASTPSRGAWTPERGAVNIQTSKSLKMHVLDLGHLRLDKNFMVANSTVAHALAVADQTGADAQVSTGPCTAG